MWQPLRGQRGARAVGEKKEFSDNPGHRESHQKPRDPSQKNARDFACGLGRPQNGSKSPPRQDLRGFIREL